MSEDKFFQRGDKVKYLGGKVTVTSGDGYAEKEFHALNETYIWGVNPHEVVSYIIEHPQGQPKSFFINDPNGTFPDGFEAVHSKDLKDGLKYISVWHGDENNKLELVEAGTNEPKTMYFEPFKFKRKDKVNYRPQNFNGDRLTDIGHMEIKADVKQMLSIQNGQKTFKPVNGTYIWAHFGHLGFEGYVIQHNDGYDKRFFTNDPDGDFPDGFESVHSKDLKDGLKYIWADESELELCEKKEEPKPATPPTKPSKAVHVQKTEAEQERMFMDYTAYTNSVDEVREIIKTVHRNSHELHNENDELKFNENPFSNIKSSGVVFRIWCKSNNPKAFFCLGQALYKIDRRYDEPSATE